MERLEARLWQAADELRANSSLKAGEYSVPVLGLIFLKYADYRFSVAQQEIEGKSSGRRKVGKTDYQARGVLYLPEESRFSSLIQLPESENIGKHINEAMKAIEAENEELKGVLPQSYQNLENKTLTTLLKTFNAIPMDVEGDVFGKIYEYFLGKFAMSEGQKGGEFFTPTSIVKLIVDVIEPYHGRIYDPACGSGGMFVQSASFVGRHKSNPNSEISVFGEERVDETVRLCRMNLAVHGLSGDIRQGNSYYEDMPKGDNGNYLWIQQFYSALTDKGRAGFVMANSASDARASELEIRKKLIEDKAVDVMVAVGTNMFFTVTLPVTLWFFDKAKCTLPPSPQPSPTGRGGTDELPSTSGRGVGGEGAPSLFRYQNIPGLCRVATIQEIEQQGWSLNPGRYVGVADREEDDFDFFERLEELNEELEVLNNEARELEDRISDNVSKILEAQ